MTKLQMHHRNRAIVEARKAYHWHSFSDVDRGSLDAVIGHATTSGQYACYSGLDLDSWRVILEHEMSVTEIKDAFETSFTEHVELLSTPESELIDE